MEKRIQTYEGNGAVVSFDPNICIHSGECVRGLPAVFNVQLKRWIRPENAPAAQVADQVRRCPSGALQFRPSNPD
jgi:uncharacterized Fe-S cluster protein YjdI